MSGMSFTRLHLCHYEANQIDVKDLPDDLRIRIQLGKLGTDEFVVSFETQTEYDAFCEKLALPWKFRMLEIEAEKREDKLREEAANAAGFADVIIVEANDKSYASVAE